MVLDARIERKLATVALATGRSQKDLLCEAIQLLVGSLGSEQKEAISAMDRVPILEQVKQEGDCLTYSQVTILTGLHNRTVAKYVYSKILERGLKIGGKPSVTKKSVEDYMRRNNVQA
jgi:hypothetical protein